MYFSVICFCLLYLYFVEKKHAEKALSKVLEPTYFEKMFESGASFFSRFSNNCGILVCIALFLVTKSKI